MALWQLPAGFLTRKSSTQS